MASNDVVLLDSLIEKSKEQLANIKDTGEIFEFFSIDQILKDYELSYDELEMGWVDGENDAGIDGIYTIIDSQIVVNDDFVKSVKKNPLIEVYIIVAKHADSFQQYPIEKILNSLPVIFNLQISDDNFPFPINNDLMECIRLFRKIYIGLVDKHPKLNIKIIYACRGEKKLLQEN